MNWAGYVKIWFVKVKDVLERLWLSPPLYYPDSDCCDAEINPVDPTSNQTFSIGDNDISIIFYENGGLQLTAPKGIDIKFHEDLMKAFEAWQKREATKEPKG